MQIFALSGINLDIKSTGETKNKTEVKLSLLCHSSAHKILLLFSLPYQNIGGLLSGEVKGTLDSKYSRDIYENKKQA